MSFAQTSIFDFISKNISTLNIATLFSGIGTPEIALKELGINFNISFACEIDKFSRKTYLANHAIKPENFFNDVSKINVSSFKGKIDLLIAGSPCQPFSIAGAKKGFEDKRGELFFHMIKRIKECDPKIVIFENVKGILTHDKGETFKIVLEEFKQLGYHIEYEVLNALDYGSVQRRKRLFLIASKEKLSFFLKDIKRKTSTIHFEELLEDDVPEKYWIQQKSRMYLDEEVVMGKIIRDRWDFKYHYDTEDLCTPTLTATLSVGVPNNVLIDRKICKHNFWTCDFAGSDICDSCGSMDDGDMNYQHNYMPTPAVRRMTPREIARFQGIPNSFNFPISDTQAYKQIGNSMEVNTLKSMLVLLCEN